MCSKRRKVKEAHAKEALKDMIPENPLSKITEGEKDLEELLSDAVKKIKDED